MREATGERPGLVILFGSGETSASAHKVYDWLLSQMAQPAVVAVLETPAGFQPNSAQVADHVADYLKVHLQNYRPEVEGVPARKRGTPYSPDDPTILAPLLRAGAVFLGPGSPTYAVRQLKESLAWRYLLAQHRLGRALILASAATIAAGAYTLPVYEIYKVGEDLHWCEGLNLFGSYGLWPAFVPHWNNAEGGRDLDTSRCFMGRDRFALLLALLPGEVTVVGIDEHTALVVDVGAEACQVMGRGGVTLLRGSREERFESGQGFAITNLGDFSSRPSEELPEAIRQSALAAVEEKAPEGPPSAVLALVEAREAARARRDWPAADALRERVAALGWRIEDTPDGPRVTPTSS